MTEKGFGVEQEGDDEQEEEIEEFRRRVTQAHDNLDEYKVVLPRLVETLSQRAEESEDEDLQVRYQSLAQSAQNAYNRIRLGDNQIVRGGY